MTISELPELHETNQEMLGQLILLTMNANGFTIQGTRIEFRQGDA